MYTHLELHTTYHNKQMIDVIIRGFGTLIP